MKKALRGAGFDRKLYRAPSAPAGTRRGRTLV
jgi:hypothetical protein